MQKLLIIVGLVLILVGIFFPVLKRLGLGHLPGDIFIKRANVSFYFPIVTCLVISIVISIIIWLSNR